MGSADAIGLLIIEVRKRYGQENELATNKKII